MNDTGLKTRLSVMTKIYLFTSFGFDFVLILSFLIFGLKSIPDFISVVLGSLTSFFLFAASIAIYRILYKKNTGAARQMIILSFFAKIAFIAIVFFIVSKAGYINKMYFFLSFIILFTILQNLEIFLIYKRVIFK